MRTTAKAVYDVLYRIMPSNRAYHGFVHDGDPSTAYASFTLGPSFGRQYNGVSAIEAVQYTVPVTVNVYGMTDTEVADYVEEIIEAMEGGLTIGRHYCIRVDTVTHSLEEDPDLAENGEVVWHGWAVFNIRLSRNVYESSSSASSGSSVSASSVSASSVSASSASASSVSPSSSSHSASSVSASSESSSSSVSTSSYSSATSASSSDSGP